MFNLDSIQKNLLTKIFSRIKAYGYHARFADKYMLYEAIDFNTMQFTIALGDNKTIKIEFANCLNDEKVGWKHLMLQEAIKYKNVAGYSTKSFAGETYTVVFSTDGKQHVLKNETIKDYNFLRVDQFHSEGKIEIEPQVVELFKSARKHAQGTANKKFMHYYVIDTGMQAIVTNAMIAIKHCNTDQEFTFFNKEILEIVQDFGNTVEYGFDGNEHLQLFSSNSDSSILFTTPVRKRGLTQDRLSTTLQAIKQANYIEEKIDLFTLSELYPLMKNNHHVIAYSDGTHSRYSITDINNMKRKKELQSQHTIQVGFILSKEAVKLIIEGNIGIVSVTDLDKIKSRYLDAIISTRPIIIKTNAGTEIILTLPEIK